MGGLEVCRVFPAIPEGAFSVPTLHSDVAGGIPPCESTGGSGAGTNECEGNERRECADSMETRRPKYQPMGGGVVDPPEFSASNRNPLIPPQHLQARWWRWGGGGARAWGGGAANGGSFDCR
jgi:hypothetical protein